MKDEKNNTNMKFHFMWTLCFLFTTKICIICSLSSTQDVDYDPSDEAADDLYSMFQEINTDLGGKAKRNEFHNEQSGHRTMSFPTSKTARVERQPKEMESKLQESRETMKKRREDNMNAVGSQFNDNADADDNGLRLNDFDGHPIAEHKPDDVLELIDPDAEPLLINQNWNSAEEDESRFSSSMRPTVVSLESETKAPLVDNDVLANILRKSMRKKLKRLRKQRRKQRIRNKIQALQSTPSLSNEDVNVVQIAITDKTTQGNTATTSEPEAKPMTAGITKTPVEDRGPKQYGFHTFYRDHAAWFGAVIGIILTISLVVIILSVYKVFQKYRRCKGVDIKNLSFSPFKDHKLDKSPMYIRLSHIQNPKTGSHYVVSVLDDKKDEEENEWSSEEEVFNISAVKTGFNSPASKTASPMVNKTSTPIKTSSNPSLTPVRNIPKD